MNPPLISIVIAVFNGAKTLQQCIDSVSQQTYLNKELIIIDGGSNDGTLELLKENEQHINYWISEPDKGIYNAWNKALEQVKGEWVCFLGADDFFWDTHVLEKISQQLMTVPSNIHVVYGKVMLLSAKGEEIYSVGESWEKIKNLFPQYMAIPHQGVMHRYSLFEQHGKFDESFYITGDYELLLRELKINDAFFVKDIIITGMRQGGVSSSPENSLTTMKEVRRAQQIHGQRFPRQKWLLAMLRVYIRLFLWRLLGEKLTRKTLDVGRRIMGLSPYWTKI